MNPEQLRALWAEVLALRAEGVSDREIDRELRRIREIPFSTVSAMERQVGDQGINLLPDESAPREPGVGDRVQRVLAPFIQGGAGSFASDIISGLESINLQPEGASERFREDLDSVRDESPIASAGAQTAGLLAGPAGKLGLRAMSTAARAGGSLLGRGASGVARQAGFSPLTQIAAGGAGRGVGATIGGAAAGGAEGAAIGFGEAAGQPVAERAEAGVVPGLISAAVAGPVAGLMSGVRVVREINQARRARGETLADEMVGQGRLQGPQATERARQGARRQGREAFRVAEAQGRNIPGELTDIALGDPNVVRTLRQSQEGRRVLLSQRAFEAGERGSVEMLPFRLVDDIRKDLKHTADAFARRRPDASGRVPSATAAREAQTTLNKMDELLRSVPGYEEGMRLWASAESSRRAFDTGKRFSSRAAPAEQAEAMLRGEKTRMGKQVFEPLKTLEERIAFREGMAAPLVQRLRGGERAADAFLSDVTTSSELQRKLRIILGSDESVQGFLREAERLRAIGQAHGIAEALVKAAGFIGGGTSLVGGATLPFIFDQ